MENRGLLSPDAPSDDHGYGLAYRLAREQLNRVDINKQCQSSGAQCQPLDTGTLVTVKYLGRTYRVTLPEVRISPEDSDEEVPLKDRILILHYLAQAKGTPLSGRAITYKELPEGASYFPTFAKRAIKPLVDHFGREPHRLEDATVTLGGRRADYGDVAVTIDAFRRVPITLVLWRGDNEFAPEGSIIFDGNIPDYLSTEDINVLCETIAWRLVRQLKSGGDSNRH